MLFVVLLFVIVFVNVLLLFFVILLFLFSLVFLFFLFFRVFCVFFLLLLLFFVVPFFFKFGPNHEIRHLFYKSWSHVCTQHNEKLRCYCICYFHLLCVFFVVGFFCCRCFCGLSSSSLAQIINFGT